MIVREIADYRVLDATTGIITSRPLGYKPILAPLLNWAVEVVERRIVLVEPQSGALGNPDPNAFMIVVPPSFTTGAIFAIQLIGTDWESEGFAVGDTLDMAMGPVTNNSILLRATILGISGTAATFRIDILYLTPGTLNTQTPFPLVAFLVNERITPRAALLRAGDAGFTSPLNGQPFYIPGHADHIALSVSGPTVAPQLYNLKYYDATQESIISGIMPNSRNLRFITIRCDGTQLYAYRSSLNPTANTPASAYPTRGQVIIDAEAPNPVRNISFETECLLLHPNRVEETNTFLTPGTLTITGGSGSISAPSIPSPVRQAICLLGPDSHHSLPTIPSSIALTQPTTPPSIPGQRAGADYVGVVTGQVGGQWAAIMTNRIASTPPVFNLQIITENLDLARYDCIVLRTAEPSARLPGTYTIILYGKVNGAPVQLASYDLNIGGPVGTPLPNKPNGAEALGMLFPFEWNLPPDYDIKTANYDTIFYSGHPTLGTVSLFYVPIPSAQEAPPLPSLTQPPSGYLLDIWPYLDSPVQLKAQMICPDGTLLESAFTDIPGPPRPDNIDSNINDSPNQITIVKNPVAIRGDFAHIYIRVALFASPAGHAPIDQAMLYAYENYASGTVVNSYNEQGTRININRTPLSGYNYRVTINKAGLPPGRYAIHVRSEMDSIKAGRAYESFIKEFVVQPPDVPSGDPLPPSRCKVNIPAIQNERWDYITQVGEMWVRQVASISGCSLDGYCGCFEIVPLIPEDWIDIIGYFRGAVKGRQVQDGAIHKGRFRGRIIRQDDEYSTEDFVSSVYRKEDIVRAYSGRYQIEIFAQTPCDLANLDILKFAAWWDVINRSNRMLPDRIYYLRPGEVSIADSGEHARVTINLRELKWRDEYRRQG